MRIRTAAIPCAAAALLLAVPAAASATFIHVVARGESLSSIAATDGLTVAQLAAANGLPPTAELLAGSQIAIPPQGGAPVESATPAVSESAVSEGDGDHDGDDGAPSPSPSIEAAPTTSTGDGDQDEDDSGAAGSASAAAGTESAATSQPVGAAAQGSAGAPPYPTAETVSPEQVSSIAAANGVPPSLASAIAYQESGFNNALVSNANAVGVMQITPGTWSWIDHALAGEAPLAPASAADNVRGGVLLLHSLLESTGGDETLAAAGYYQGLPSVLENGMEPATEQYVNNVKALQQRFGGG